MANSALEYYADSLGNTVLRDADGNPSIFVRHPKQKSNEFDPILPDHVHPAFIVNNVEDPAILIGKYMSSELASNGTQYSLPNMPPRVNMAYDTFLTKMKAFGGDVTGLTIADHGLLVLMAHKAGFVSHGNNSYGADYRAGTNYTLGKAVAIGDKRIFRGWEYTCLIAHTTADTLLPTDAPAYWQKGKQVGGTPVMSQVASGNNYNGYNTLTGSGPIDWNMLDDPCLEADIQGNALEQVYGVRLVNCEIQIIPDNNAADPECDLSATSSAWRAIKPHANDDGYDLVAPGTEGTVHYNWLNSKITLDTVVPNFDGNSRNTAFKSVAVNTENLPYVPTILYELGLAPIPGTTVDGTLYVTFVADERVARRGGGYSTASYAGVASLGFYYTRSASSTSYGARPRSRQKT